MTAASLPSYSMPRAVSTEVNSSPVDLRITSSRPSIRPPRPSSTNIASRSAGSP